jgi:hypothetical protein
MSDRFLSVSELAEMLSRHPTSARRWVAKGENTPPCIMVGKRRVYSENAVRDWLRNTPEGRYGMGRRRVEYRA